MSIRYRFDMQGAIEAGEVEHPEVVIRKWFPLASALEPVSIADCWIFETPDERLDAPAYFIALAVL